MAVNLGAVDLSLTQCYDVMYHHIFKDVNPDASYTYPNIQLESDDTEKMLIVSFQDLNLTEDQEKTLFRVNDVFVELCNQKAFNVFQIVFPPVAESDTDANKKQAFVMSSIIPFLARWKVYWTEDDLQIFIYSKPLANEPS